MMTCVKVVWMKSSKTNLVLAYPCCTKLRKQSGQVASFWMSHLDIVDILLDLIRESREGHWQLHLNAIHCMIPWCFAYDRHNYARYHSIYYSQMTSLLKDHPFSHEYLQQRGLSVQRSEHNPFEKVPIDQTLLKRLWTRIHKPLELKALAWNLQR